MEGNEIDNIPLESQGSPYITAQQFKKDEATGFLVASPMLKGPGMVTANGVIQEITFNPDKKLELIKLLQTDWPDLRKACYAIGISVSTHRNHYRADQMYAQMVDEIVSGETGVVEAFQKNLAATNKFAFMDRAMFLKANNPGKFDTARKIIVESNNKGRLSEDQAKVRMVKLKNVIDAEVVSDGIRENEDRRNAK